MRSAGPARRGQRAGGHGMEVQVQDGELDIGDCAVAGRGSLFINSPWTVSLNHHILSLVVFCLLNQDNTVESRSSEIRRESITCPSHLLTLS